MRMNMVAFLFKRDFSNPSPWQSNSSLSLVVEAMAETTLIAKNGVHIPVVIGGRSHGTLDYSMFVGFADTQEVIIANYASAYGDIGIARPVIILCEAKNAGYNDTDCCFVGWSLQMKERTMEEFLRDEAKDYDKKKMCLMIMEYDTYSYAKAEADVKSSDDESSHGESDESEDSEDDDAQTSISTVEAMCAKFNRANFKELNTPNKCTVGRIEVYCKGLDEDAVVQGFVYHYPKTATFRKLEELLEKKAGIRAGCFQSKKEDYDFAIYYGYSVVTSYETIMSCVNETMPKLELRPVLRGGAKKVVKHALKDSTPNQGFAGRRE